MTCECQDCREYYDDRCPITEYCSSDIDLHCKRCNRYFCSNHWNEANDQYGKWDIIENDIYQIPGGCDACWFGCPEWIEIPSDTIKLLSLKVSPEILNLLVAEVSPTPKETSEK